MRAVGRYDGELQMYVEEPREPTYEHLLFLRWLVERGHIEHPIAGPPRDPDRRRGYAWDDTIAPPRPARPTEHRRPNLTLVPPWFGR